MFYSTPAGLFIAGKMRAQEENGMEIVHATDKLTSILCTYDWKEALSSPCETQPAIFIWFGFCCFFFLLVFFLVFLPALPVFPLLCPLFSLPSPSLFLPIPVHSPFPCPSLLVSLPFLPNFFFFDLSLLLESPYLLLFIFLLLFPSWKLVLFLSFSLFSFLFL